ncbi:hypothetical protein [Photobacterium gaetbulicola]|uniref:hypothetical protein n=1 Tax=Photobacterium gaetbulicola TaxID=1295392 RepID=UPI000A549E9D|nr:hypothetical protein [Photobacterium gaetbulicola]
MSNFYHGPEPGRRRRSQLRRPRRTLTHLTTALDGIAPTESFAVPECECTALTSHPTLTPLSKLFRQQG